MPEQLELPFKMELGGGVLRLARNQNYSPWGACGEWVDNSIQAYKENRKALKKIMANREEECLTVRIHYEAGKTLRITDNSSGMDLEDLKVAFSIGKLKDRPDDDLGQNNAGMKNAAIWMGKKWEIKTKKFNSTTEYTINANCEKLFADNLALDARQIEVNDDSHYTIIQIEDHWPKRKWKGRTLKKVKKFLASMYKPWIQDDGVRIFWNDEEISAQDLIIATRVSDQSEYKWTFRGAQHKKNHPDYLFVEGFFGLLEPSSTANDKGLDRALCSGRVNAGISIYRRRRMIMGYPEAWKPEKIFGEAEGGRNDRINQRVFGIINVDDSEVSQDKQQISHPDLELIEDFLKAKYDENEISETANSYVAKGKVPTEDESKIAMEEVKQTIEDSDLDVKISEISPPETTIDMETENIVANKKDAKKTVMKIGIFTLNAYSMYNSHEADSYLAIEPVDGKEINILINMKHPYISHVTDLPQYLEDCIYDGIALWQCRELEREQGKYIVYKKDKALRLERV